MSNYSIVQPAVGNLGTLVQNHAQVTASCPAGTAALGGGYLLQGSAGDLQVMKAQPTATGYVVDAINTGPSTGTVQAWVSLRDGELTVSALTESAVDTGGVVRGADRLALGGAALA